MAEKKQKINKQTRCIGLPWNVKYSSSNLVQRFLTRNPSNKVGGFRRNLDALLYKPLPSAPEESFDHGTVPQIWRTQLVSAPRNNPEKVISQTKKGLTHDVTHYTSQRVAIPWGIRTTIPPGNPRGYRANHGKLGLINMGFNKEHYGSDRCEIDVDFACPRHAIFFALSVL